VHQLPAPAFRLDGKCFVWFGAAANHCAIYGMLGDHKDELNDYDTSKGTIRFQADKAMPAALVRKLIKSRIAENVDRSNKAPRANHINREPRLRSNRNALPHCRPTVLFSVRIFVRRGRRVPLWRRVSVLCKCSTFFASGRSRGCKK
jgi:hypothetical protein